MVLSCPEVKSNLSMGRKTFQTVSRNENICICLRMELMTVCHQIIKTRTMLTLNTVGLFNLEPGAGRVRDRPCFCVFFIQQIVRDIDIFVAQVYLYFCCCNNDIAAGASSLTLCSV